MEGSFWENIFEHEDNNILAEGEEKETYYANKDCIIFLIDCQRAMFEPNERGEIPFENAVKCAIATLTDKIISSENDLLGICFYGTKTKQNPNDFEGITVFMELDVPDAQKILDLESLLRNKDFGERFGFFEGDFPFCDALWTCSTLFSLCAVKVAHKRIFLFTNDDNPNSGDLALRERGLQRAKDLDELGINLELFSMNKLGQIFDPKLFFQQLISFDVDEDTGHNSYDAAGKFEELVAKVRKKEFKKRSFSKLSIFIGDSIEIGVRLFNIVQETKKGTFLWLDAKTNQPVKTMTKWVCEDTGTLLMPSQIKYGYAYGGERVIFDKDEIVDIKTIDKQGLRLMGFKPLKSLKFYHNYRSSTFLYPDEQAVKGSSRALGSLLERLIAKGKYAICRYTPRSGAAPHFVALVPQTNLKEEVLDEEDGSQVTPPGFHMIHLPFADDIRSLQIEPVPKAAPEQVLAAKKIIKHLRIKFDSPLQKHYGALQALALERESEEEVPDFINPDLEGMDKSFSSAVFPDGYVPDAKTSKKRKLEPKELEPSLIDESDLRTALEEHRLSKYNMVELRSFLKSKGVKGFSKWKKDELVDKVTEFLQGHPPGEPANRVDIKQDPEVNQNRNEKNKPNHQQKNTVEEEEEEEPLTKKPKKSTSQVLKKVKEESPEPEDKSREDEEEKEEKTSQKDELPKCKYGSKCYRKNPDHFRQYRH